MGKKAPETVRLKKRESEDLKDKAWELSKEADEMFRESELVHLLIEEGLERIKIVDGKLKLT
jgi:hypothetical protein